MWTPELAFLARYAQSLRSRLALFSAAELQVDEAQLELPGDQGSSIVLEELEYYYGLSELELDILLFAAAPQLDPSLRAGLAAASQPLRCDYPTPYLWLKLQSQKEGADFWSLQHLFAHNGPLFEHGLVELVHRQAGRSDNCAELFVPSDVLALLRGSRQLDERNHPFITSVALDDSQGFPAIEESIVDSAREILRGLNSVAMQRPEAGPVFEARVPLMIISGARGTGKTALLRALCRQQGLPLLAADAALIATQEDGGVAVVTRIVREASTHGELLLFDDAELLFGPQSPAAAALCAAAARYSSLIALVTRDPSGLDRRVLDRAPARLALPPLRFDENVSCWELALIQTGIPEISPDEAARRFPLDGRQVANTMRLVDAHLRGGEADDPISIDELNRRVVVQLDGALGDLGTLVRSPLSLEDLVLPQELRSQLDEVAAAFLNRTRLFDEWGFGRRVKRGRGIICLFDGDPGTGKTMSAEVLANSLGLQLQRVNTSQVIDKYIGETEKKLAAIFQSAHPALNLLLFDEADSLFAKRTKVERSTDRYANAAINVLLQLVEDYEGLVVLDDQPQEGGSTRLLSAVFTFKLSFSTPDERQRALIWQRFIPEEAPIANNLDFEYLARELELSGGGIKNAVVRAAYLALHANSLINMDHLLEAGYRELASSGKLVRQDWE